LFSSCRVSTSLACVTAVFAMTVVSFALSSG
jgi:hypothetical protein